MIAPSSTVFSPFSFFKPVLFSAKVEQLTLFGLPLLSQPSPFFHIFSILLDLSRGPPYQPFDNPSFHAALLPLLFSQRIPSFMPPFYPSLLTRVSLTPLPNLINFFTFFAPPVIGHRFNPVTLVAFFHFDTHLFLFGTSGLVH